LNVEKARCLLTPFNPWWHDPEWIREDPLLQTVRKSVLRKPPRLYYHIRRYLPEPGYYGIVTIRGPRRVGKTTLVMMIVNYLVSMVRVRPRNVFYVPLDYAKLRDVDLFGLIDAIAQLSGEKYIFLDEASMRRDWALILKNLVDAGLVERGKLKIVVTGSHSMDLADAASKLSGRQGRLASLFNLGGNLIHVPLRFVEVLEAIRPDIDDYLRRHGLRKPSERFSILLQLRHGTIPRALEDFYSEFATLLDAVFEDYLLHGGFPKAVDQYHREGVIDPEFYHDFAKLVISDSVNTGLNPENTRRILEFLTKPERLSSLLGLGRRENIGRLVVGVDEEGFPSPKFGLGRYLEYLETTKIFLFPYREDSSRACTPNYRADRKVYVLDPFSYHALRSHIRGEADPLGASKRLLGRLDFRGRLIESVVAAHLAMAQQFFEHVPSVDYHRVLLYSRDGDETDYVLCLTRRGRRYRFLIESKYRRRIPGIPGRVEIVLTRDKLEEKAIGGERDKGKFVYVPVVLFLMLF